MNVGSNLIYDINVRDVDGNGAHISVVVSDDSSGVDADEMANGIRGTLENMIVDFTTSSVEKFEVSDAVVYPT